MRSELVKRNRELEEENSQLRAAREALEGKARELEEELAETKREREYLEHKLEQLRHMLFGRRSEKLPPRSDGLLQLELFEEAKAEIEAEKLEDLDEAAATGEPKKRRPRRKRLCGDLPREHVELDVDPALRVCPDCGQSMSCIGEQTSEELEYIPALLYIVEYVLKKYACRKCQTGVVMERLPARPIKEGEPWSRSPRLPARLEVSRPPAALSPRAHLCSPRRGAQPPDTLRLGAGHG